jgi:D-lactate dehydrogenase
LFHLEKALDKIGRAPHSVIGSSCIGASVFGGVCNNSGGALIHRGPAFTQLALFARLDEAGDLYLVNHLGIALRPVFIWGASLISRRTHFCASSGMKSQP